MIVYIRQKTITINLMSDDRYRPAIQSSEPSRCEGAVRSWEINDRGGNRVEVVDYNQSDSAFEAYGASSKGPKRERDEDFIRAERLNYPDRGLNESVFVMCDGMGGHGAGDQASELVANRITDLYTGYRYHGVDGRQVDAETALRRAAQATDTELKSNAELARVRAGSTAVVCVLDEKTGDYVILNIGDSFASLVSRTENRRLTSRHEAPNGQLINCFIASPDGRLEFEDGLRGYHNAGVLKEQPAVIHRGRLVDGQALVLACDGADDVMPEFPALLNGGVGNDGRNPAFRIAERANAVDGSDNVSAIVITGKRRSAGPTVRPQSASQPVRQTATAETRGPNPVERNAQAMLATAKTPQELWDAIGKENGIQGSRQYFSRTDLYAVASDVLEGRKGVLSATSGDGFRAAIERVGCRYYARNMTTAGHGEVFEGADLKWGDEQALYHIIDQLGPVAGTAQEFQPAELKKIAERVLNGQIPVAAATRTQGFRTALTKMLDDRDKNRRR